MYRKKIYNQKIHISEKRNLKFSGKILQIYKKKGQISESLF